MLFAVASRSRSSCRRRHRRPSQRGELDCNGQSPVQQSVKMSMACTDIRGFDNEWNANTWSGRFYDNGDYIGHDEPDMTFLSN